MLLLLLLPLPVYLLLPCCCCLLLLLPAAAGASAARGLAAAASVLLLLPWRIIAKGAQGNPRVRIKSVDGTPPEPEWTIRNAIGTLEFWLLVQAFFFTAMAAYLTTVQTIAFLIDRGYPALDAAFAFGVAGMLSIFGVLMSGWASQRFGILRSTLVSYAGTLIGIIALFAFSIWPHGALVLIFVLGFGTSQGARGPVISSLNARIFAHGRVSSIYGLIFMLMSFGAATGSWPANALRPTVTPAREKQARGVTRGAPWGLPPAQRWARLRARARASPDAGAGAPV